MLIYPAIDLMGGAAVRLHQGDYGKKTEYSSNPLNVALDFRRAGAEQMHIVDLEGARSGATPHLNLICHIRRTTGLFCQVGGGIRSLETAERYLRAGVDRVIFGTAAVTDPALMPEAVRAFGEMAAVGIDIKDGRVAIHGWTETSSYTALDFCARMEDAGVRTMIVTDISKDGAMEGTNRELYRTLSRQFSMNIIASGGVSSLEDVKALREMGLYGAIIGKAYYTGAISLPQALEAAR